MLHNKPLVPTRNGEAPLLAAQRRALAMTGKMQKVILIGPNGWASLDDDLHATGRHTALGYHKRWWRGVRFFHSDGSVYEIESAEPERPLGAVSKVLAMTVYNPWLQLTYKYRKVSRYSVDELRSAVAQAIREDDDVLTQFEEEDQLIQQLSAAEDFHAVVSVLRRGIGG